MGAGIDFQEYLDSEMHLPDTDLREYSPLVLAYIGDAIYDLVIRTVLVKQHNCQVQKLHRQASALVKASAQAAVAEILMPYLTEEEEHIYKRGRNAKSYTKAKNADTLDYRRATGLEALMGYLYLKKDMERIVDLMKRGIAALLQDDPKNHGQKDGPQNGERPCDTRN